MLGTAAPPYADITLLLEGAMGMGLLIAPCSRGVFGSMLGASPSVTSPQFLRRFPPQLAA